MADDWLWLANAKAALHAPRLFLERPMYGYFRPLNLAWVFILFYLIGAKAYAFGVINILLHAVNIVLFWKVLEKFEVPMQARMLGTTFFAFYFLNASAICWISVGHDLWVTLLSFIFTLKMFKFLKKPGILLFMQILLLGLAATLFKEAGFITIGLYFLMLIMYRKNPFIREYRPYSLIMILIYAAYLVLYFKTRTVAERDVVLSGTTIVNLWYLLAYLITPFSARVVKWLPENIHWLIATLKIIATILVPLIVGYTFWKKEKVLIYFALWSIMSISTVAVFDWRLGLFDFNPVRTASRFMYVAVPGLAVIVGWLVSELYSKYFKRIKARGIAALLIVIFISANWLIISRVIILFRYNQNECNQIIADLKPILPSLTKDKRLLVLTDDLAKTPQIINSEIHLEAILYVIFNKKNKVVVEEMPADWRGQSMGTGKNVLLLWNTSKSRLQLPDGAARPDGY